MVILIRKLCRKNPNKMASNLVSVPALIVATVKVINVPFFNLFALTLILIFFFPLLGGKEFTDGRYKQPTIRVSIQCAATTKFRGPFGIIQFK